MAFSDKEDAIFLGADRADFFWNDVRMKPLKVGLIDVLRRSDVMFLLNADSVSLRVYRMAEEGIVAPISHYRGETRNNLEAAIGVYRYPDGNIFELNFTPPDRYRRIPRQEKLRFR